MLDIKFIRQNPNLVKEGCKKKQVKVDIDGLLELDEKRRKLLQDIEELQHQINLISAEKPTKDKIEKGRKIKVKLKDLEGTFKKAKEEFNDLML